MVLLAVMTGLTQPSMMIIESSNSTQGAMKIENKLVFSGNKHKAVKTKAKQIFSTFQTIAVSLSVRLQSEQIEQFELDCDFVFVEKERDKKDQQCRQKECKKQFNSGFKKRFFLSKDTYEVDH